MTTDQCEHMCTLSMYMYTLVYIQ